MYAAQWRCGEKSEAVSLNCCISEKSLLTVSLHMHAQWRAGWLADYMVATPVHMQM